MPISEYYDLSAKGIIAFFFTIGWTIILYPILKNQKKSWPILIISSTILTLFLFFIKEHMDHVTPLFDEIITYFLGTFFAIVFISIFFNLKTKNLYKPPENIFDFINPVPKSKIHLRHIIQMGIIIEEEGNRFYRTFADNCSDFETQHLCIHLAEEETKHRLILQDILYKWLPIPIDNNTMSHLKNKLKEKGIFFIYPPSDIDFNEFYKNALNLEESTIKFYHSFRNSFGADWKRLKIDMLIEEENKHLEMLKEYRDKVRN